MFDTSVFSGIKTKQDFDREREEFELRKRQRAMQEQLGQLSLQKAQSELSAPKLPFQGTSFDAQIANEAYRFNLNKGMSEDEARRGAVDMVLGSKTDYSQVTDPYTGETSLVPKPRAGIFGASPSPVPAPQLSYQTGGFNPDAPMPLTNMEQGNIDTAVNDPLQANRLAAAGQAARNNLPDRQNSNVQLGAPLPLPVLGQGDIVNGAPSSQVNMPLDPRAATSPDVQKDTAKKVNQANIDLLKEQAQKQIDRPAEINEAERAFISAVDDSQNINQVLDTVIGNINPLTTGMGGAIAGVVPGSEAVDLSENLKTIEADAAFTRLQQMRDQSKTGGALGQVSERELGLLSAARAALSQRQSDESLMKNIKRYRIVREKALRNVAEAFNQDYGYYPKGFDVLTSGTRTVEDLIERYGN